MRHVTEESVMESQDKTVEPNEKFATRGSKPKFLPEIVTVPPSVGREVWKEVTTGGS
jgi:hypothetical protein